VKITVTLTIPPPCTFDVNTETMLLQTDESTQGMDVVAETMSLSYDESLVSSDDEVTSKEPNIDTGNQDMNIGAETMSLKDKKV
jgi:hypothetical protein